MAKCNKMTETKFRSIAKKAVVDYWNSNKNRVDKFGEITSKRVYFVWQVKAVENFKALLGVSFEGDGYYFEFTWDGTNSIGYLDVYRKLTQRTIQ